MEFRLVVEHPKSSTTDSFTLEGREWSLTEPLNISDSLPEYTCISYVWGSGRVPHPLTTAVKISDHTLPALAAAIRNHDCRRFWIDAFCIPPSNPEKGAARAATLESMGFIYSRAKQVIAVLSRNTFEAFVQMSQSDRVDERSLEVLEQDEWVMSAWTYQEVINSQNLLFVCEDEDLTSAIIGSDFLNRVGFSLELYKSAHSAIKFDIVERFPRLSTFVDLIADRLVSMYQELSALQVMGNMDRRLIREPKSRFYSMIGAISQERSQRSSHPSVADLSEAFMAVCEKKNDFSFIYSAANRDILSGRRWRPIPGSLPSILPWHGWGEAQHAHESAEGFWLDNVQRLELAPTLGHKAKQKIATWTRRPEVVDVNEITIAEDLYPRLRQIGFTGSQEYLVTEDGLFFPQHPLLIKTGVVILVSTSLAWTLGAPGLAKVVAEGVISYVPGVFVGYVTQSKASSVLLGNEVEASDI
jgi:Heterokaryon incompatibility protein (HET)